MAPRPPRVKSLCGLPRRADPGARGDVEQQLVVTAELEDGSTRDVTRQAAYDVSDPDPRRGLGRRTGARARPGRDGDRRPLSERAGDQPAGLPRPTARVRLAGRRPPSTRSTGTSSPSSRPCGSIPRRLPTIRSSSAGPISTRSAGSPIRPRRRAFLADRDPPEAEQAGRSPGRSPRVRRLLGAQVGRPAPQRREDDGREGRLGLPALAARRDRPRRSARRAGPPDRRRPGLDLAEPAGELPPDQPRPDDRRGERRPGLPRHPPPVRPLPQPPVRRLDPGRLLRPGGLLRQRRPQAAQQRPQGPTSTSTRSTATRSSTWPVRPGWSSPRTGAVLQPTCPARHARIDPADGDNAPGPRWPTG